MPPIRIIFFVKSIIEKLDFLVPSTIGSARNPGTLIIFHSGIKDLMLSFLTSLNILLTK